MNDVQQYTLNDLVNFILDQPDDKPINMEEAASTASCGCILVHLVSL